MDVPEGIRVLSNGAGFDEKRKRIVYGPGTFAEDPNRITSERGTDMITRRWQEIVPQKAREAMLTAVKNGKQHPSAQDSAEAWGALTQVQAEIALSPGEHGARASTEAYKAVARATDSFPDKTVQAVQAVQINISVGDALVSRYQAQNTPTIEGRFSPSEAGDEL